MADIKVKPPRRFEMPPDGPGKPPPPRKRTAKPASESSTRGAEAAPLPHQLVLFAKERELTLANQRIADLEIRLSAEQEGRRADIERIQEKLLREIAELKAEIARLEAQAKPPATS